MNRRQRRLVIAGFALVVMLAVPLVDGFPIGLALSTLWHMGHGEFSGSFQGRRNALNPMLARPGDVLLLHNEHGAYGYFTHAVLCVGKGKAIDANDFALGVLERPLTVYRSYDGYRLLRYRGAPEIALNAAHQAKKWLGVPYDPLVSLSDRTATYCSKLVWQAYFAAGVHLRTKLDWYTPDDLAKNPLFIAVASKPDAVGREE